MTADIIPAQQYMICGVGMGQSVPGAPPESMFLCGAVSRKHDCHHHDDGGMEAAIVIIIILMKW